MSPSMATMMLQNPAPMASILSSLTAEGWIDAVCAVVVATAIIWDAIRGLSATLAHIAALIVSFKLAFHIYPYLASLLSGGPGGANSAAMQVAAFILTLVVLFLLFALLRFVIARVAHVVLVAPVDNVLGALAGLAKGLLAIFLVFSLVLVIKGGDYPQTAFAKSWTGRRVMPALEKAASPARARLPVSFGGGR